jgi:hypothetical protein
MAGSREAGEETIDEAVVIKEIIAEATVGVGGGERGRARQRDHGPSSRGATPDRTSRSRSTERGVQYEQKEQGVIANRPAHLNSGAKLLQAGFGQADRVHGNTGTEDTRGDHKSDGGVIMRRSDDHIQRR